MKKVEISYNTDKTDLQEAINEFMDSISDADLRTLYTTTHSCKTNGDIWHNHYMISDSKLVGIFVFDSDDAFSNWSAALTVFESAPNHASTNAVDVTFEEFAAIAQEADVEFINMNPRKTALDDEFGLV